jgi:hypothetical protein
MTHAEVSGLAVALGITLVLLPGCSCGGGDGPNSDGGPALDGGSRADGARVLVDGNGFDVNAPEPDAFAGFDGNGFDVNPPNDDAAADDAATSAPDTSVDSGPIGPDGNGFDVGPAGCFPATCAGHQYQCGDCIDNDHDGLIDSRDPDCLNQCDNTEDVYDLGIPGGDTATCMIDCYYDSDQGPGNDGCTWDYRCDMLSPGDDSVRDHCAYDSRISCPATQTTTCHSVCGPITPNGCDCFGCCEITPASGMFVYLGSTPSPGHPQCSPSSLHDPLSCRPCTPVADCFNTCGHCELCFGRDTLPPDCFPPPPVDAAVPRPDASFPDGGHPDAYSPSVDAAVPPTDSGIPPRCTGTAQPCGLPGDPACPANDYCITGCCQFFG